MDDFTRILLSALVTFVISVPGIFALQRRGAYVSKDQKIIAQAKAAGRVTTGYLKSKRWSRPVPGSRKSGLRNGTWFLTYEYAVDGRIYHYSSQSENEPPEEIAFYYPEGFPQKAIPEGSNSPGVSVVLLTVLPIFLWAFLYNFVFV